MVSNFHCIDCASLCECASFIPPPGTDYRTDPPEPAPPTILTREQMSRAWQKHARGDSLDCEGCVFAHCRVLTDFLRCVGAQFPNRLSSPVTQKTLQATAHRPTCTRSVVGVSLEIATKQSPAYPQQGSAVTLITVVFDEQARGYRYQVLHYAGESASSEHAAFVHVRCTGARSKATAGLVRLEEYEGDRGFLQCFCVPRDEGLSPWGTTPLLVPGYPHGVRQAAKSKIAEYVSDIKSDKGGPRELHSLAEQISDSISHRPDQYLHGNLEPASVVYTAEDGQIVSATLALCQLVGDRAAAAMQLGAATIGCKNPMERGPSSDFRVVAALELYGVNFSGHKLVGFASRSLHSPQFLSCISTFSPVDCDTTSHRYRGVGSALVENAMDAAGPGSLLVPECPMSAMGCHMFAKVFAERVQRARPVEGETFAHLAARTRVPLHFLHCLVMHEEQRSPSKLAGIPLAMPP